MCQAGKRTLKYLFYWFCLPFLFWINQLNCDDKQATFCKTSSLWIFWHSRAGLSSHFFHSKHGLQHRPVRGFVNLHGNIYIKLLKVSQFEFLVSFEYITKISHDVLLTSVWVQFFSLVRFRGCCHSWGSSIISISHFRISQWEKTTKAQVGYQTGNIFP